MEEMESTVIETAEAAEPTESAPVETEETEETGDEAAAESHSEKTKRGIQKRFDEMTAARREAERREEQARRDAEYWREMAMRQGQPQQPPQEEEVFTKPKPTREQFEYDEDQYLEALTDWKLEQREAKAQAQAAKQRQAETQKSIEQTAYAQVEKGRAEFKDFDTVTNDVSLYTQAMATAVLASDIGYKISYYLGKNPQEAQKIAALPPARQVLELGKIEERLSRSPEKKQTGAPPPITPVGTRSAANAEPDAAKDPEGWQAWERARVRALGRRY